MTQMDADFGAPLFYLPYLRRSASSADNLKTWMAGTSPAMTIWNYRDTLEDLLGAFVPLLGGSFHHTTSFNDVEFVLVFADLRRTSV